MGKYIHFAKSISENVVNEYKEISKDEYRELGFIENDLCGSLQFKSSMLNDVRVILKKSDVPGHEEYLEEWQEFKGERLKEFARLSSDSYIKNIVLKAYEKNYIMAIC